MMQVFISRDEIAEGFDICRFARIVGRTGDESIEDLLCGGEVLFVFYRGERKFHDEFEVGVATFSPEGEAGRGCHRINLPVDQVEEVRRNSHRTLSTCRDRILRESVRGGRRLSDWDRECE